MRFAIFVQKFPRLQKDASGKVNGDYAANFREVGHVADARDGADAIAQYRARYSAAHCFPLAAEPVIQAGTL